ncbi:Ribose transport system permease protein RbsC [Hartmannibacter diazotrophicus]|uniref:Ribose transport system permease protein RbsC n=1 Tax=Hartmannibacter diazotrophicus TaxID=1482074 RepID=A0A2C9D5U4_9HYPH|nr:ABC transporter permease [Hartmannibacter diazotrophicus]SON55702.1 Ribose transport system permease protein RbsC [Hartmannibacter diazotrophicus]
MIERFLTRMTSQDASQASLVAAIVLFAGCALFVPHFLELSNLSNVLRVSSILALAASGQALVIIMAGIDFSVGSSVAFGSVMTVLAMQIVPVPLAFAAGAATMIATGGLNGLLIAYAGLPPFLATLGMLMLLHSTASIAVGGLPVEASVSEDVYFLGRGIVYGIPVPILIAAVALIALHVLLAKTSLGRRLRLIGSNPEAARLAGLPVRRTMLTGYAIAGCFVALAGLILTSRVASGQPNLMPNLPFESIAACAIGGISLAGGRGSAVQVLWGVLIIAMINNAIVLLNLPAAAQLATLGIAMAVAASGPALASLKRLSAAARIRTETAKP